MAISACCARPTAASDAAAGHAADIKKACRMNTGRPFLFVWMLPDQTPRHQAATWPQNPFGPSVNSQGLFAFRRPIISASAFSDTLP